MARPKKYFSPMKDFHFVLEEDFVKRAMARANSLNLSFVAYVQKLITDDVFIWEHEERQKLLKSLKGEQ